MDYVATAVADANPVAQKFYAEYQALPYGVRSNLPIEHICIACGISVSDLTGAVVATAMRQGHDASELTAKTLLPTVVHQLGRSAQRIGGEYADVAQKDRTLFLQSQKFAPSPQGARTTIAVQANASAKAAAAATAPSVPSFLEDMRTAVQSKETVQGALSPYVTDGDVESDED